MSTAGHIEYDPVQLGVGRHARGGQDIASECPVIIDDAKAGRRLDDVMFLVYEGIRATSTTSTVFRTRPMNDCFSLPPYFHKRSIDRVLRLAIP